MTAQRMNNMATQIVHSKWGFVHWETSKRNRCYEIGSKEHYVDIFSSSLASATFIEKTAKSEQRNYLFI